MHFNQNLKNVLLQYMPPKIINNVLKNPQKVTILCFFELGVDFEKTTFFWPPFLTFIFKRYFYSTYRLWKLYKHSKKGWKKCQNFQKKPILGKKKCKKRVFHLTPETPCFLSILRFTAWKEKMAHFKSFLATYFFTVFVFRRNVL